MTAARRLTHRLTRDCSTGLQKLLRGTVEEERPAHDDLLSGDDTGEKGHAAVERTPNDDRTSLERPVVPGDVDDRFLAVLDQDRFRRERGARVRGLEARPTVHTWTQPGGREGERHAKRGCAQPIAHHRS